MHVMKLAEPHFTHIKTQKKTFEARINDEKRQLVHVHDLIQFHNTSGTDNTIKEVIDITYHNSFRELIVERGVQNLLPDISSVEEGVNLYESIGSYKNDQWRYGVVCFELK